MLAFVAGGLEDFSVSRSRARARGWGIPVPDDPAQVVYVWWDALGNYITALDYGTGGAAYGHWWAGGARRVHLIGKGILRFHAVYWPAMLLSARRRARRPPERLPGARRRADAVPARRRGPDRGAVRRPGARSRGRFTPQGSRETARQGGSDSAPLPPATPLFARIVEED